MKQKFTLLIISLCFFGIEKSNAQVNTQDSLALVDLYNGTNGANWYNHTNWLTKAPVSSWYGVSISGSRVTGLYLLGNALNGILHSSIGNLTSLTALDLTGNYLGGNIPSSIGNLINLTELRLLSNHLTGTIPATLSKLVNLSELNFGENKLTGSIPSSLSNLTNLNLLILGDNNLSGTIPSSLGNLSNLIALELFGNEISGSIPSSFKKLKSLGELSLSYNQLSGNISFLSELKALSYLDVSHNQLNGNINFLGQLDTLGYIDLSNNHFTGNIPIFRKRLTLNFGITLNLSFNQLSGKISNQFDSLSNFNYLSFRLNNNLFNGEVGLFDSLKNLQELNLSNNQFTFAGMENIATKYPFATYAPQADIPVIQKGKKLSVAAGGTLANNTYQWYKNGQLFKTVVGDSTLSVSKTASFYVNVTNSVAKALTLHSDTVNFVASNLLSDNQTNNIASVASVSVYPNPAITTATLSFPAVGKYSISIIDINGKTLQTISGTSNKTLNMVELNVASYSSGMYLINIKDETGNTKTIKLNKR